MIDETKLLAALEADAVRRDGRRAFFKAAIGAAAIGAGGFAMSGALEAASPPNELDILNFALNLEYLEANFYSFAVFGQPIEAVSGNTAALIGSGDSKTAGVSATGGSKVTFKDTIVQKLATEIAQDEIAHVKFLRQALGTYAVAQPKIDLSPTGAFAAAAAAAKLPTTFSPYADDGSFLLGAFLFEDVGVTAYRGAMSAISTMTSPQYLDAASGILSVEAQHAAAIRTELTYRGYATPTHAAVDTNQVAYALQISDARDSLDGASDDDQGITPFATTTVDVRDSTGATFLTESNIAPVDANGLVYSRTTGQVLNIVYLKSTVATSGGFFPSGVNGAINSSTAAA